MATAATMKSTTTVKAAGREASTEARLPSERVASGHAAMAKTAKRSWMPVELSVRRCSGSPAAKGRMSVVGIAIHNSGAVRDVGGVIEDHRTMAPVKAPVLRPARLGPEAAEDNCGVVAMTKAAASGRKSFRMDDLLRVRHFSAMAKDLRSLSNLLCASWMWKRRSIRLNAA